MKTYKRHRFGNKVSFVMTSKSNWLLGALSLQGSPYDGHTLEKALNQVNALTDKCVKNVYCDQGYRGMGLITCEQRQEYQNSRQDSKACNAHAAKMVKAAPL